MEAEEKTEELSSIAQEEAVEHNDIPPYEDPENVVGPTVVSYDNYKDPLQIINRPIFKFNDVVYRYGLTPISKGYLKVVPKPVDKSIGNFFHNLREPLYSINQLFQGRLGKSGKSILRFGINTTVGILGLFDPANAWGLERNETNLEETLAHYGVSYGIYLVLPFLGPSDLRDITNLAFNYVAHPLNYVDDKRTGRALLIIDGFHSQIGELARYREITEPTEDPYIFIRNFYLQRVQRDADYDHDHDSGEGGDVGGSTQNSPAE